LKDEKVLYTTICRSQAFYEKTDPKDPLARVIMRRLEHIYSKVSCNKKLCVNHSLTWYIKPNAVVQALESAAASDVQVKPTMSLEIQGDTTALIHALCAHL